MPYSRGDTFHGGKAVYSKLTVCECLSNPQRSNYGRCTVVSLCTFCSNCLHNSKIYTWFSIVGILFMPQFWADNLKASIFWKYYLNRSYGSLWGVSFCPFQEEWPCSWKVHLKGMVSMKGRERKNNVLYYSVILQNKQTQKAFINNGYSCLSNRYLDACLALLVRE